MTSKPRVAHVAGVDVTHRFLLLRQLSFLRDEGYDVTAISAPGRHVSEIEDAGIRHLPWPHITRAWDVRADARALVSLVRLLRREEFDIVHTHNPKPGVMGRVAARLTQVPCVVNTVHGLYAMPGDPWHKRAAVLGIESLASRFSDFELYQSEEDLRWARRRRVTSSSRSELLGNGTDLQTFDPNAVARDRRDRLRRELSIPSQALVVGTVGRLVAEKGYRELFAAAELVRARVPSAHFLVVGASDPDKADAISQHEVAAAQRSIVFAGWRTDVRDLLAVMDLFVLPSWREGVPRSVIEAAAMGRPLVVTDIRGCREVVRHGREGILVPPRDVERLASAIESLLTDEGLRSRMASAARLRAEQQFDENRVFRTIALTYERLLGERRRNLLPSAGTKIRRATVADTVALGELHTKSLPTAFLPSLGRRFMQRLYTALVIDPDAIVVVAEERGRIVGFAAGVRSVREFYRRFFRKHGLGAAIAAGPRLFRGPTLRRALETARYPHSGPLLPDAELLAIAVGSEHRRTGMGGELATALLKGLAEIGVDRVKVIVAASNGPANRFYGRMGFIEAATIAVHEGTPSKVWIYGCRSLSLKEGSAVR